MGEHFGAAIAMPARRPLCCAACLFALGVWAGLPLGAGSPSVLFGVALGVALAGSLASRALPGLSTFSILLAFSVAGAGAAGRRAVIDGAPVPEAEELLEGRVAAQPQIESGRTRFVLDVERVLRAGRWEPVQFGLKTTLAESARFLPGDYLRLRVRMRPLDPPLNPGAPDWLTRAAAEGVAAQAVVVERQYAVLGEPSPWRERVADVRAEFGQLAEAALPHAGAAALVRALAMGERAQLAEEVDEDFTRSGLAHVLSVSGLHIAVVAAGLYRLLRWLLCRSEWLLIRVDVRALASLAGIPVTWLYVVLTGAEVPAVRSGIMTSALFLAFALGRDEDGPSALGAALLAVLAWDPAAARSVSFQLSFCAVAGLMLLSKPLRRLVPLAAPSPTDAGWKARLRRAREVVLGAALASLAASLATAPLVAGAFQRASLVAVVANAAAIPLASLLTCVSAAAALAFPLSPSAAGFLVVLAGPLARGLLAVSHAFAMLPFASARVAAPSAAELCTWGLGLLALTLLRGHRRVGSRLLAASVSALLLMAGARELGRKVDGRLSVTFLSVGQGDATLVRLPGGRALLVDGGGDPAGHWDVGSRVVAPAMVALGVRELEAVVLTHPHPDHCLGLLSVLEEFPARELWVARGAERGALLDQLLAVAQAKGTAVREFGAGERIDGFAPVELTVLHPPPAPHLDGNDASLVLRLALGDVSFLLAGDVENEAEAMLLGTQQLRATVLKAPHHGSSTSSSEPFVRAVAPEHVVFSVGRASRFGFPHAAIVSRYEAAGSALHRTDRDGAITFRTDGKGLLVERYRERWLPRTAPIAKFSEPEERP